MGHCREPAASIIIMSCGNPSWTHSVIYTAKMVLSKSAHQSLSTEGQGHVEVFVTEKYFDYDVALSFAGEQREYVERVANDLKSRGIRPFYDDYEKGSLWGKDLYAHLNEIYQNMCRYCVIFVSKEYAAKVWPNRERQSAQARAVEEKQEYILPARFDDTPIPGLLDTVGYIDLNGTSPKQLGDLIAEKLGTEIRQHYLPPTLDRLYERLGIEADQRAQEEASSHAWSFLEVLRRMTADERDAVLGVIRFGCPSDLPDNIHIDADLLRRFTDKSEARLKRLLGGVQSLGFRCSVREDVAHKVDIPGTALGHAEFFYLDWFNPRGEERLPALLVATEMISGATENYCEEHGTVFIERLDFSQLASATASEESHQPEG